MTDFDPTDFRTIPHGHSFEDFEPGLIFEHHWGRTLYPADNTLFTTATLAYNPLYFNHEYAQAEGHPSAVINPFLVLCTVVGLSVEDLSEAGGPFLGIDELTFHRPVHSGETLTARSVVVSARESESQPGFGVVTWHTEAFNQDGELVIDYKRTNLARKRAAR